MKILHFRIFWICVAIVLAIGLVVLVISIKDQSGSPLPSPIAKQVSFVVYIPAAPLQVAPSDYSYNPQSGVLSFTAHSTDNAITFNEQAAPSQFNDIPQFYPTLLTKLNQFKSIGTANGTVNLVRPTELKGKEEAVVFTSGTLVFVSPAKPLSTDSWRTLFNTMQVIK